MKVNLNSKSMFRLSCAVLILLLNANGQSSLSEATKVDPLLATKLAKGEKANVVVSFHKGVRSQLDNAKSQRHSDRGVRNKAIVQTLQKNAEATQQGVLGKLSARSGGGFDYHKTYWTSNRIFIKQADATTVKAIEEDPSVSKIKLEPKMRVVSNKDERSGGEPGLPDLYWNMLHIKVPEAWEELGGKRGTGVVVANIDSGVKHTHDHIKHNFRGEYGWFDGVDGTLEPFDPFVHGTGMMGILAGEVGLSDKNQTVPFGVVPDAKWMACRGCDGKEEGNECSFEHLMNCIQFMSCPTLANGSNPDCSKAPHVLSFSIGGERSGEDYDDDFLTMKELGIIPVAGVGNDGYSCGTTHSPANMPWVIGVGGIQHGDVLWSTSAIGPAPNGTIKPDIVAPACWVLAPNAQSNRTDAQYITRGTSAATPHVAGVIALLHVRNPDLTFEEAYQLITQSAEQNVVDKRERPCKDNITITSIPNNFFGYGRVDALRAVKAQTAMLASNKTAGK